MKKGKEITIRSAGKKDSMAIDIILSSYFLDRDDLPYEQFYVAETDGKVIGCAVFERLKSQDDCFWFYEIHTIAVLPMHKGKGYGKQLLSFLISEIRTCIGAEKDKTERNISETIYTRTTAPGFFIHEGFEKPNEIDKKELWKECVDCSRFDLCSQTVLMKRPE